MSFGRNVVPQWLMVSSLGREGSLPRNVFTDAEQSKFDVLNVFFFGGVVDPGLSLNPKSLVHTVNATCTVY